MIGTLVLLPSVAFATSHTLKGIIGTMVDIVNTAIPVAIAIAVLTFFWGLAGFILQADNEQKRYDGKQLMIWGIIGLFVIISIWGIVAVISNTFFNGTTGFGSLPTCTPQSDGSCQ